MNDKKNRSAIERVAEYIKPLVIFIANTYVSWKEFQKTCEKLNKAGITIDYDYICQWNFITGMRIL